jgi:hypothetical protein
MFDVPTITLADYEARIARETERIQQILPRRTPPSRSAVVCIEDGLRFSTTRQASVRYGTTPNAIRQSIYLGLSAAGKHWRRVGRRAPAMKPVRPTRPVHSHQLGRFGSVYAAAKRAKQQGVPGSVQSISKRITNCLQHGRPLCGTEFTFTEVTDAT